jgi:pyruvate,water dikinase
MVRRDGLHMPASAAESDTHAAPGASPAGDGPVTDLIVHLDRLALGAEDTCGAKATRLAHARRAGLEVPDGFVVTTQALMRWLESPCAAAGSAGTAGAGTLGAVIADRLGALTGGGAAPPPREVERTARELAELFRAVPLPAGVEAAVLAAVGELTGGQPLATPVAVRSSAPHEDGERFSFAGHHDTVLDVRGGPAVLDAVRTCLISSVSERALAASSRTAPTGGPRMAVLVQRMVRPELAGILFTRDPVHGLDRMVLELVRGSGEGVAAGSVNPARFAVDRRTGAIERLGGDPEVEPPVGVVHALSELGRRLEELFRGPQDVEWATRGTDTILLQTRPVTRTVADMAGSRDFWTSANSQEALQAPVTPLTYTLMLPLIDRGRRMVFSALGVDAPEGEYMRLHLGRVYFNTGYFRRFLERVPGAPTEIFDMLLFGEATGGGSLHFPKVPLSARLLGLGVMVAREWLGARRRMDLYVPVLERRLRRLRAAQLRRLRTAELCRHLLTARGLMERGFRLHVLGSAMAGGHYLLLSKWLCAHVAEIGQGAVDELLGVVPGVATADAYDEMLALAAQAQRLPEVRRAILERPVDEVLAALPGVPGGQELSAAVDAFMERYGHLALTEAELAAPRWREDRGYIVRVLRRYLERGASDGHLPERVRAAPQRRRRRGDLLRKVQATLRRRGGMLSPLRKLAFRSLLRWAERYAPYRENMRFHALRAYEHVRNVVQEMGRRLAERGHLTAPDDVFFVEWDELRGALGAAPAAAAVDLAARALRRRREYERACAIEAPKFIWDDGAPAPPPARLRHAGADTAFLEGVPVSGGVVRGRVRRCANLDEALSLGPEDILLARLAPPAWTPAFLLARGVILDIGGMLSHCAVIAREHGIPCVVGVRNGTQMLQDGEEVTLDAYTGRVYVHR